MINLSIIYTCHDCEHKNRQELGMPGFEPLTYRFHAFSDAVNHIIEHEHHYIESLIEQDPEAE